MVSLFVYVIWPAALFVLLNIAFTPSGLPARSRRMWLTFPAQLWKVATNESLKRNHALEHATINVIEETYGPQPLAGAATADGFVLRGITSPRLVEVAARRGLYRLKQGERRLAVHRRCGTSIGLANLLTSSVAVGAVYLAGRGNWLAILVAVGAVHLAGPYVGRWAQTVITTSPRVEKLEIIAVEATPRLAGFYGRTMPVMPVEVYVTTRVGRDKSWSSAKV